jgi:hypothetical protein
MKLNIKAFALALGIVLGLAMGLVTLLSVLMHWEANTLWILHKIFPGYSPSWLGALMGLLWGFIYGGMAGLLFAWLYNSLVCEDKVKKE